MLTEGQVLVASHDPYVVALSVFISLLAAYAAVALSERVRDAPRLSLADSDKRGRLSLRATGQRLPPAVLCRN
jgi:hypothetical protein